MDQRWKDHTTLASDIIASVVPGSRERVAPCARALITYNFKDTGRVSLQNTRVVILAGLGRPKTPITDTLVDGVFCTTGCKPHWLRNLGWLGSADEILSAFQNGRLCIVQASPVALLDAHCEAANARRHIYAAAGHAPAAQAPELITDPTRQHQLLKGRLNGKIAAQYGKDHDNLLPVLQALVNGDREVLFVDYCGVQYWREEQFWKTATNKNLLVLRKPGCRRVKQLMQKYTAEDLKRIRDHLGLHQAGDQQQQQQQQVGEEQQQHHQEQEQQQQQQQQHAGLAPATTQTAAAAAANTVTTAAVGMYRSKRDLAAAATAPAPAEDPPHAGHQEGQPQNKKRRRRSASAIQQPQEDVHHEQTAAQEDQQEQQQQQQASTEEGQQPQPQLVQTLQQLEQEQEQQYAQQSAAAAAFDAQAAAGSRQRRKQAQPNRIPASADVQPAATLVGPGGVDEAIRAAGIAATGAGAAGTIGSVQLVEVPQGHTPQQADLQCQVQQLEAEDHALQTQNQALQTQDKALQTQNYALQTQNQALQTQSTALQTQNQALQTQNQALQTHNQTLQAQLAGVQQEKVQLGQKVQQLERRMQQLQQGLQVMQQAINQV